MEKKKKKKKVNVCVNLGMYVSHTLQPNEWNFHVKTECRFLPLILNPFTPL